MAVGMGLEVAKRNVNVAAADDGRKRTKRVTHFIFLQKILLTFETDTSVRYSFTHSAARFALQFSIFFRFSFAFFVRLCRCAHKCVVDSS